MIRDSMDQYALSRGLKFSRGLSDKYISKRIFISNVLYSYYETRKKSILVNIELYNVDEQIKNHFY